MITTLPTFVSNDYYMILGVGYDHVDVVSLRWWHALVTPFVHGRGGPAPPLTC